MNKFDPFVENVRGMIIGGEFPQIRASLVNAATGQIVEPEKHFDSKQEACGWAKSVVENRKQTWGHDYAARYPKGIELRIMRTTSERRDYINGFMVRVRAELRILRKARSMEIERGCIHRIAQNSITVARLLLNEQEKELNEATQL